MMVKMLFPYLLLYQEIMRNGSFTMILFQIPINSLNREVMSVSLCLHNMILVLQHINGLYLIYGKEGLLQVGGNSNDTRIYDQQLWRLLKSHSSHLELMPTSIYDDEIVLV